MEENNWSIGRYGKGCSSRWSSVRFEIWNWNFSPSSLISEIISEVLHNIKQNPKFIITCTTCSPLITCPKMISFSLRSRIGAVVMKISNPLFLGFPLGVPTKKASCFKLIAQITTIRNAWNWTARYQPSTMN